MPKESSEIDSKKKLTVTFSSKKYLRVRDNPRTISVRNKVFMLLSKTATGNMLPKLITYMMYTLKEKLLTIEIDML